MAFLGKFNRRTGILKNGRGKVYFLGAGSTASVSYKEVVTGNLLEKIIDYFKKRAGFPEFAEEIRSLDECLALFSSELGNPPGLLDFVSLLDMALHREKPISRQQGLPALARLRKGMPKLVQGAIAGLINKSTYTTETLHRLAAEIRRSQPGVTVISMNWDCLFEEHWQVAGRGSVSPLSLISYGIETHSFVDGLPDAAAPTALTVLKPHGSINWGCCDYCGKISTAWLEALTPARAATCPVCKAASHLEPFLVLPSFLNVKRNRSEDALWEKVENAVAGCDELIFIGYSMPVEDLDTRFHLTRGMLKNPGPGGMKVTVVGRGPSQGADAALEARFRAVFGKKAKLSFHCHPKGLAHWVNQNLA